MAILWKDNDNVSWNYPVGGGPAVKSLKPDYAGLVLGKFAMDIRIMSDVWATGYFAKVWDPVDGKVVNVGLGNSEFGSSPAVVDAPPDVVALADAFDAVVAAAAEKAARVARVDRLIDAARRVAKGKDVDVIKGRKVKIGSKGRVFWLGDSKFGMRVGLELVDGSRVFTALSNVAVSNPDDDLDVDELMAMAA